MKRVKMFWATNQDTERVADGVQVAINEWLGCNQDITGVQFHPTFAETGSASGECSVSVYTVLVEYDNPAEE